MNFGFWSMKSVSPCRAQLFFAVTIMLSACGPSDLTQMSQSESSTSVSTAEQVSWKRLTAQADAALKHGHKAEAEQTYKMALSEAEKLGADNPTKDQSLVKLANFYYVQGSGGQADKLYRRSLAEREKLLGMEHVDLSIDLLALARISSSQKKYLAATAFFRRAIALLKKAGRVVSKDTEEDYARVQNLSLNNGDNGGTN